MLKESSLKRLIDAAGKVAAARPSARLRIEDAAFHACCLVDTPNGWLLLEEAFPSRFKIQDSILEEAKASSRESTTGLKEGSQERFADRSEPVGAIPGLPARSPAEESSTLWSASNLEAATATQPEAWLSAAKCLVAAHEVRGRGPRGSLSLRSLTLTLTLIGGPRGSLSLRRGLCRSALRAYDQGAKGLAREPNPNPNPNPNQGAKGLARELFNLIPTDAPQGRIHATYGKWLVGAGAEGQKGAKQSRGAALLSAAQLGPADLEECKVWELEGGVLLERVIANAIDQSAWGMLEGASGVGGSGGKDVESTASDTSQCINTAQQLCKMLQCGDVPGSSEEETAATEAIKLCSMLRAPCDRLDDVPRWLLTLALTLTLTLIMLLGATKRLEMGSIQASHVKGSIHA